MLSRRDILVAAGSLILPAATKAQTGWRQLGPYPIPRELSQPISFGWSGELAGATGTLAARLGYSAWVTMSTGLPVPDPPPSVPVSVGFSAASPVEIVEALNRTVARRAVVILDPYNRFIGVVYYG